MAEAVAGTEQPFPRFGSLLLSYRRSADLTQEELAGRAGISVRALRNLERGRVRAARARSAEALAEALRLDGPERAEFLRAALPARRAASPITVPGPRPKWTPLVSPVPDFTGREAEIEQVRTWWSGARGAECGEVVAIVGPPGVGKTALSAAIAARCAPEFPDGCLAVSLRGTEDAPLPPDSVVDLLLRAAGVAGDGSGPGSVPLMERLRVLRGELAGRRALLLLDDAADESQVRPLLVAGAGCLTLVTCRRGLSGLAGVRWLRLGPLPTAQALTLVAAIVGRDRVRAEREACDELVRLCENLPLAIRIAANRVAQRRESSVSSLVGALRDEQLRLTTLSAGDLQLRTAFERSYRQLSPAAQRLFRLLAPVPAGEFGLEVAAAALDAGRAEAFSGLDELADASLVLPAPVPRRYVWGELVRSFAAERLEKEEPEAERHRVHAAVRDRLDGPPVPAPV